MAQVNRDDLNQIVGPLLQQLSHLRQVIEQLDGTDADKHATIASLEAELAEERKQKLRAEHERDEFEEENQQLRKEIARLAYRNDERGLPRVCCRCPSNTVIVTCKCGAILLADKPYKD